MLQKLYTENSNEKIRNKSHSFLLFHWLLFFKIGHFLQMQKGIHENPQKTESRLRDVEKSYKIFHKKGITGSATRMRRDIKIPMCLSAHMRKSLI